MTTSVAANPIAIAPGGLPLVGHLPQFMRDRLGFLTRCAETDAAVALLRLDTDAYLLLDADDIKHVLESNHPNYDKTPRLTSARGRELSGNGVLTSIGKAHLEKRKMLQPVFAASSFMPLADIVVAESARLFDTWRDGQILDAADALMNLSQQINGKLLFSADYATTDTAFRDAIRVRRLYMMWVYSTLLPFGERLPLPLRLKYVRQQRLIEQEIQTRINQRRADPDKYNDLLTRLVQARYSDGRPVNDAEIIDESTIAAITGYETIGEALAWTCFMLGQNRDVADRLAAEVRGAVGDTRLSADDLPKLKYVEMVLNESMRLYPPTWIYIRMARQTDRLPSGVDLPAGAKLYLCPWAIHRSARYFDDPLRFDPLRFTDENRKARPKYAYFPFGGGPRICIGQALAKMQMPLTLAALVQRFDFELLPDQHIKPDPKITLRPIPGIRLRLRQR
jgi:cytochrome P450